MKLHISYGNNDTERWETIEGIEFDALKQLNPDDYVLDSLYGILNREIILADGEKIVFNVVFDENILSLNIVVLIDEVTVLNFSGVKQDRKNYDPSIVFYTPAGNHISLMIGP